MKREYMVVRKEKIELLKKEKIPEGTRALVTDFPESDESEFWLNTIKISLDTVWNNQPDDGYAPTCGKNDAILLRYPFTDLSSSKVRSADIISIYTL